jgi:hypothetical protein
MCALVLSTILSKTFLTQRLIQRDMIIKVQSCPRIKLFSIRGLPRPEKKFEN